jgi:DNA invertase Pin-like site-specific DNA recombinase
VKRLRCAIYTRKSSEEGLEQGFNSLHAQREACAAYVLSQAGEGWEALAAVYDDGGYSGGSMDRPSLQALLADIRQGRIDIVVVYKVDRLTRSLADFARIVELFDAHGVSFVSVTQAFNTTTSMGRLTLNVLLSFAQFEREVTGERIRDKIAASKAKGLWMGGRAPLGYDGLDRKLVINPAEAETVRFIFSRYLELGSARVLAADLAARGVLTKARTLKTGETYAGCAFSRGGLYYLLSNPVYRGAIRHGRKVYPDAHPAIIDETTWDKVQALLANNGPGLPSTPRASARVLMGGVLRDDRGVPMQCVHTSKGPKRYRYYASRPLAAGEPKASLTRIAVGVLDEFVIERVFPILTKGWAPDLEPAVRVSTALSSVTLGADRVLICIKAQAAVADLSAIEGAARMDGGAVELAIAIRLKNRQGATVITTATGAAPEGGLDRALIRAICLTRRWAVDLGSGVHASIKDLAAAQGLCEHYVARLLPLAWLAPDLVEMVLEGRQPRTLMLSAIAKEGIPPDWDEQRRLFGSFT